MGCGLVTSSCQVLPGCGLVWGASCGVGHSRVCSGGTQLVLQVKDESPCRGQ